MEIRDNAQFCYVVPAKGLSDDERQDCYVAILQANPATVEEAVAICRTVHNRHQWNARKERNTLDQLVFDPEAMQPSEETPTVELLNRLGDEDRELIEAHVLGGESLRDIAEATDVSRETIRKRYNRAKQRLQVLREAGVVKTTKNPLK